MVFHNLKATCISYEIYQKYYFKLPLTQLHLRNIYLDVVNFLLCCHGALYQMWHSCQGKQLWASSEITKKKYCGMITKVSNRWIMSKSFSFVILIYHTIVLNWYRYNELNGRKKERIWFQEPKVEIKERH